MKNIQLIIVLIALITVASGATQIVAPSFVLNIIGVEVSPSNMQLFATVGMFMVLFGGLALHAIYSEGNNKIALLWCGFQKFGAAVAVSIGVWAGVFSILAGAVAGFDLVSGILYMVYLKQLKD